MKIELEAQEASLLFRVLNNRLKELRVEVRHTRDMPARDYLLHKERILNRILAQLSDIDPRAHQRAFETAMATP